MTTQIADLGPVLAGIQADVAPLQTGLTTIEQTLAALQASAGNPATTTTLTPADQSLLDAAHDTAVQLKGAFDALVAALPAATPAPDPSPAAGTTPAT